LWNTPSRTVRPDAVEESRVNDPPGVPFCPNPAPPTRGASAEIPDTGTHTTTRRGLYPGAAWEYATAAAPAGGVRSRYTPTHPDPVAGSNADTSGTPVPPNVTAGAAPARAPFTYRTTRSASAPVASTPATVPLVG
jgi:hypothetical protein